MPTGWSEVFSAIRGGSDKGSSYGNGFSRVYVYYGVSLFCHMSVLKDDPQYLNGRGVKDTSSIRLNPVRPWAPYTIIDMPSTRCKAP
jgi:hypothetical protein